MSESNVAPIKPHIKIPAEAPFRAVTDNINPLRRHQVRALAVRSFQSAVLAELNDTERPVLFSEDDPLSFEIDCRVEPQLKGVMEIAGLINQTREFKVECIIPDEDTGFGLMIHKNGYEFFIDVHFSFVVPKGLKECRVLTSLYEDTKQMQIFDLSEWNDRYAHGKPVIGGQERFIHEIMSLVGTKYVEARYNSEIARVIHRKPPQPQQR